MEPETGFADVILPACTNFERNDIAEWANSGGYSHNSSDVCNHRIIVYQQKASSRSMSLSRITGFSPSWRKDWALRKISPKEMRRKKAGSEDVRYHEPARIHLL